MTLQMQRYREQTARWPSAGRHILAQHDDDTVVVYQAYRPAIGEHALAHGRFGGPFSYERMSWIKPNFLWMMYRSGWGSKPGQEVVLAVRLEREFFEQILAAAVHSSYVEAVYGTHDAWKAALASSDVRLQWDPDHHPRGAKLERRAIQLGLRGDVLRRYGTDAIVSIEDASPIAADGRARVENASDDLDELVTPRESVLTPRDAAVRQRLELSDATARS